ncbi:MAG: helix-turn-helix domain-containing protein [Halobacteriaceae archaeon]
MSAGVRVTVAVTDPERCPVAAATTDEATTVDDVTHTESHDGRVAEQFRADGSVDVDGERVFERDETGVYRFERPAGWGCVCEVIERTGVPVSSVRAADGHLRVSFHAVDGEEARTAVERLQSTFDGVTVDSVLHSVGDAEVDTAVVNRNDLTDRQREVIETAREMGYFEYPRDANAAEVAAALGIAPSTFSEHLTAAQAKVLDAVFG